MASSTKADTDNDGTPDDTDNCVDLANPDQADTDNDGIGNACEADTDNDGTPDDTDNCVDLANPDQADDDNDGIGNACEAPPVPTPSTTDQCKKDGWRTRTDHFGTPFKNQGDCVSYVVTDGRNLADGA
jgi:hypothetical protein